MRPGLGRPLFESSRGRFTRRFRDDGGDPGGTGDSPSRQEVGSRELAWQGRKGDASTPRREAGFDTMPEDSRRVASGTGGGSSQFLKTRIRKQWRPSRLDGSICST